MSASERDRYLTPEIASVELLNIRPLLFQGYVLPFVIAYAVWFGYWFNQLGATAYMELGLIVTAVIGFLQILSGLFCHWFVNIRCLMMYNKESSVSKAAYVKIVPTPNTGSTTIVNIERRRNLDKDETVCHSFFFQRLKYTFESDDKNSVSAVKFPIDWTVAKYMDWRGYTSADSLSVATEAFGLNELHLTVPLFSELFKERATAPFFVFQIFCVALWCLDEYWVYPCVTLMMLCLFECGLVQQQLKNMSEIRSMGAKPYQIYVYRQKKWTYVLSDQLVAGDIVSISDRNRKLAIPCDVLLLRGSCIVDESMLTGESVPVTKEACETIKGDEEFTFDESHKPQVLFGGTKIVQLTSPLKTSTQLKAPDNGCICFVLRTGLNTLQGRLLKTIMYSVKTVTANNVETFMFIAFLLVFAIIAAAYVWIVGSQDSRRNRYKLFLECTLILTSVIPQELPIELSLAVNTSLIALCKLLVYCTEPFRIPFAGKVDICAFDKTGTLTEDKVMVEGVTGLNDQPANKLVSVQRCPLATIQVLASCHSLIHTSDGLIGDPMEIAMLASTGWNLNSENTVHGRTVPRSAPLRICQRFRFSSALQRMSVVVSHPLASGVEQTYLACCKGSPEVLRSMLTDAPPDYDEAYLTMARRGARVLALGQKDLGLLSHQEVRDMTRDQIESGLSFCGFVLISCPLKPDSKEVVHALKESSHHVTMITGDNPLTACHVSIVLDILRSDVPVLVLTPPNSMDSDWHWQSVDDSVVLPAITAAKTTRSLTKQINSLMERHDLCMTGEGMEALSTLAPNLLHCLIPKVKVYARVVPRQKEDILIRLKALGYVTLMCGDGTNDVGALKQAHVGVALLNEAPPISLANDVDTRPAALSLVSSLSGLVDKKHSSGASGRQRDNHTNSRSPDTQPGRRSAASRLGDTAGTEDEVPVVRLGDASIAAPFTAKMSSPTGVCQIIKQGRCTLITTLQMYKILAINALVSAYSFSVLFLKGFKTSDMQASLQAILLSAAFLFISRAKPLKSLSRERPIPNIFNVYTLLTVTLQFMIHLSVLYALTREAEARMPVKEDNFIDTQAEFEPSVLNTVVYLISTSLQITTIVVNYKGYPFMEPLVQNRPIVISLSVATVGVVLLSLGAFATTLRLIPLDTQLRLFFLKACAFDLCASWAIDRLLLLVFGRVHKKAL